MSQDTFFRQILLVVVLILDLCSQVISEYCGETKYCQPPYKCCNNAQACCYDHENGYTRGFKLHVWNMWYFWLVIIFILMSCFGGCGYYRRRRLAALRSSHSPSRNCPSSYSRSHSLSPTFYAYTGPGVDTTPDILHLPPPYAEVMEQPNLYPVSKVDLPPYPGPPATKDENPSNLEEPNIGAVNPPPYSESRAMPEASTHCVQAGDEGAPTGLVH